MFLASPFEQSDFWACVSVLASRVCSSRRRGVPRRGARQGEPHLSRGAAVRCVSPGGGTRRDRSHWGRWPRAASAPRWLDDARRARQQQRKAGGNGVCGQAPQFDALRWWRNATRRFSAAPVAHHARQGELGRGQASQSGRWSGGGAARAAVGVTAGTCTIAEVSFIERSTRTCFEPLSGWPKTLSERHLSAGGFGTAASQFRRTTGASRATFDRVFRFRQNGFWGVFKRAHAGPSST